MTTLDKSKPLTQRQRELLDFIRGYFTENGMAPSLREMADALGVNDLKGVRQHLERLERAGHITRLYGLRRAVQVVPDSDSPNIPVYGKVAAGLPLETISNMDRVMSAPEGWFKTRPDFFLEVSGDSMEDAGILDGDLVAVKRIKNAQPGQIVVAMIDTDEMSREERKECGLNNTGITLKRLAISGNKLMLKSENKLKDYAPLVLKSERVRIEGRFVGLLRGG